MKGNAFVARLALSSSLILSTLTGRTEAGQIPGSKPSVRGLVLCGETNEPARFAEVWLISLSSNTAGDAGLAVRTTTSWDGEFAITDLPPGVYAVNVKMPGYVTPIREQSATEVLRLLSESGGAAGAGVTTITVGGDASEPISITLKKGAVLSGSVLYEDGVPASQVIVNAVCMNHRSAVISSCGTAITDDRGMFRVTGLDEGTYTVEAKLSESLGASGCSTFLGNVSVISEAKLLRVAAGEKMEDLLLKLGAKECGYHHTVSSRR